MQNPGLIITADDYGLNQACNAGIRKGVEAGIVTSVHVLMNMVTQQDLDALKQSIFIGGNKCGIGLHLNTTWGKAFLQTPASFKHTYEVNETNPETPVYFYRNLNTYVHKDTNLYEMRAELMAQFHALANYLGGPQFIDAVSSHQNIHFWDGKLIEFIHEMCRTATIPVRSPLRWVTENQTPQPPFYAYGKNPKGIGPLVEVGLKKIHLVAKIPSTGRLLSTPLSAKKLHGFYGSIFTQGSRIAPRNASGHWFGQPSWKAMEWFLNTLPNMNAAADGYSSEIYMHLADSVANADRRYDYKQSQRVKEFVTITHPTFINAFHLTLRQNGIRHGSYRQILQ